MVLVSTWEIIKQAKIRRVRKVPNLGCVTPERPSVQAKILQEGIKTKSYPYPKQMHSRAGAFILQEERICHQNHHLLCPLSRRISNQRYLPDKDICLKTCLLLSESWISTEKGCQILGHLHFTRLRHWVPYLLQYLIVRSVLGIPNSFPRDQGERLEQGRPWWKRMRSGNTSVNETYINPWALVKCLVFLL